MAVNYKIPPTFSEESNYGVWKNEVDIWRLVTDLDKKKQALAVALRLSGKPREVALEIPSGSLNADDGMTVLINTLDSVFLTDEHDNSYLAYTQFEQFRKLSDMCMNDYIIDFERLYNKTKKFNMELPDTVLAFKLLDSCQLSLQEKQLALTATKGDKSYLSMKSALKRIFGDKMNNQNLSERSIKFKEESAFYTGQQRYQGKSKNFNKFQTRSKGKTNPLNKYGKPSRCSICQSIFHWRKDCPDDDKSRVNIITTEYDNEQKPEQCNALFTKESHNQHEIFVIESLGSAIIDTACTRTVCGKQWLQHFIEQLDIHDREQVISVPSNKAFKFGDGKTVYSFKLVTIPATISGTKCTINTEVVSADIPLLLSKESLQKAGTVLDLKNDKAEMFNQPVQLELTSSGHYCINILSENVNTIEPEDITLIANGDIHSKFNKQTLEKLHKQFGHASVDRLKRLLQSAEIDTSEWLPVIKDIIKECEVCTI